MDEHCLWCQYDMWESRDSGMHEECEVKWERRKALRTFIEPLVNSPIGDQINVDGPKTNWTDIGRFERKVIDIALLIEQYIDTHTGEDHGS